MNGLWRWKPGPPKLYPMPDPAQRIYALVESDDGGILIAKHSGITKLRNGKTEAYPLPAGLQFQPHRLLRDRNGGLWIGALVDKGLLHIHDGKNGSVYAKPTACQANPLPLSLRIGKAIFGWRPWMGLDRFRDFAVPTISVQQGLSSRGVFSILAARDGSLWLGTSEGLNRWNKDQITVYRNRGSAWRARWLPGQRTHRGKGRGLEAHDSGDYRQRVAGQGAVPLSGRSRANVGRDAKRGCLS